MGKGGRRDGAERRREKGGKAWEGGGEGTRDKKGEIGAWRREGGGEKKIEQKDRTVWDDMREGRGAEERDNGKERDERREEQQEERERERGGEWEVEGGREEER